MKAANEIHHVEHDVDVCVIGGGMAGMCAAIAAARNGAKTILVHDRPVLGGNASSEVRMWICGAHGKHNKETGLLEEIQLDNLRYNPSLNYSIWDAILWAKAYFQPNLTLLLNASCNGAQMQENRIAQIEAWQTTSQTVHRIRAKNFIDASGDSVLAALTPAQFRHGREAREEFDEEIQPLEADDKTMGNSLLIQLRRTDDEQPFTAPRWAYKFTTPEDFKYRMRGVEGTNFWWIEVGGLQDTIKDAEAIRDELTRIVYGVWDYIKNYAPEREKSRTWAVEWIGSLPGKRENRRYVGDHILTQNDIRAEGKFEDVVAFGGWPMDDHHPAGLYYEGTPTIFHEAPAIYGIPYRCLYSKNIENLFFAGRNISVTHAALSSTRVMATCALIGQAAGTAAALCREYSCAPRDLSTGDKLRALQNTLMDDDCWLPGVLRPISELAQTAKLSGDGQNLELLIDGLDRDRDEELHSWTGKTGDVIVYEWKERVKIGGARFVFDSNLANNKRQPCSYPQKGDSCRVPKTLVKTFRLEARDANGAWNEVARCEENYYRLMTLPLAIETDALRLVIEETWGNEDVRIFGFEPLETLTQKIPAFPDGPHFSQVRAQIPETDMREPESGLENRAIYAA
jgi:hypothetical protein